MNPTQFCQLNGVPVATPSTHLPLQSVTGTTTSSPQSNTHRRRHRCNTAPNSSRCWRFHCSPATMPRKSVASVGSVDRTAVAGVSVRWGARNAPDWRRLQLRPMKGHDGVNLAALLPPPSLAPPTPPPPPPLTPPPLPPPPSNAAVYAGIQQQEK